MMKKAIAESENLKTQAEREMEEEEAMLKRVMEESAREEAER